MPPPPQPPPPRRAVPVLPCGEGGRRHRADRHCGAATGRVHCESHGHFDRRGRGQAGGAHLPLWGLAVPTGSLSAGLPARLLQRRGPRKSSADASLLAEPAAPAAAPTVAETPAPEQQEQREQRVIPTRSTAVHHQAPPPPQQRPQRRFAGYNVRRGGGALSPRTTVTSSGGPRRQQPWQMLLPAGVPPAPLTPDQCRHQVMADLVYLFKWVPACPPLPLAPASCFCAASR